MQGTRTCAARALPRVVANILTLVLIALLVLPGCNSNKRPPRAQQVRPAIVRDVPTPLRGTIGAVCRFEGARPVLVSGIGFVVGLNGTGGLPLPTDIAATMERQMRLNGIGPSNDLPGTPFEGMTASQLLRDPNTAVVIVQGAVPPGSPDGTTLDVYVRALNATSLEGGTLWTTELRLGLPSQFGAVQARAVGQAKGPIFINPFAEPGAEADGVTRTAGRILDGGVVTITTQLILALDNPSHSMARAITEAINNRFPRGRGDDGPIASGRDSEFVKLRIPYAYRNRQPEFIELVRYTAVDQSYPEANAKRFADALQVDASLGDELSWALQAVGPQAKPFLRNLYGHADVIPRLAALRAGAGLNDPRVVPYLIDIASAGPSRHRTAAIGLLAKVDGGPEIETTLQSLLASDELPVRVGAYEALADRAEAAQLRRLVQSERAEKNPVSRRPYEVLYALSRSYLPSGTIHGVSRELVEGKFFLDRVPVGKPLVYITQQRIPRIVLFGEDLDLHKPLVSTMWSDRLMFVSDAPEDPTRIYYRTLPQMRAGEPIEGTGRTILHEVKGDLTTVIKFLAHTPTPENPRPGLSFSYSEVVGALYGLYKDRAMTAAFSTERDRLLADIVSLLSQQEIEVRPERIGEDTQLVVFDDPRNLPADRSELRDDASGILVPLRPAVAEQPGTPASGG